MTTELRLPELGENIDSGNVVRILVSVGQEIARDQPVLELETDKATIEVPSSVTGVVKVIHVQEGGKAKVGQVVLTVESDGEGAVERVAETSMIEASTKKIARTPEKKEEPTFVKEQVRGNVEPERVRTGRIAPASPSVRQLAREIGMDINQITGTGPGGRITVDDVKRHSRQLLQGEARAGVSTVKAAPALPDFGKWGEIERKAMSGIRRKTAEHLATAWANIPQVTQFDKADITELEKYRRRFGEKVEQAGGKLTVTAILIKVSASALKVFPQFNASVDMAQNEIIYKKYIHIGVAVDTDRGLLVPVIRDVDRKNILQLSTEISQLAEKTRNKKLTLEEMQGGCFTVTNLGGIGGTQFSPIVNFPEVAILGVSRNNVEPAFRNGQFEPRTMLPLSLSYDHRVIDGADAARFLRWICEALQDPFLLALEG